MMIDFFEGWTIPLNPPGHTEVRPFHCLFVHPDDTTHLDADFVFIQHKRKHFQESRKQQLKCCLPKCENSQNFS